MMEVLGLWSDIVSKFLCHIIRQVVASQRDYHGVELQADLQTHNFLVRVEYFLHQFRIHSMQNVLLYDVYEWVDAPISD